MTNPTDLARLKRLDVDCAGAADTYARLLAKRNDAIRDALAQGASITALARELGLSRVTIYAIRDRQH